MRRIKPVIITVGLMVALTLVYAFRIGAMEPRGGVVFNPDMTKVIHLNEEDGTFNRVREYILTHESSAREETL
jgi:hypothetical protein